jgi:CheY-like chemotaxis protein
MSPIGPLVSPGSDSLPEEELADERRTRTGPRPRPRVLIVDDQEATREMYAWCMRAAGWLVEESTDGEEAVVRAREFQPDVIAMDLHLPVLDGLEAMRLLKQDDRTRDIPIVACTGVNPRRSEALARDAGCDGFVSKPCLPEELRVLLETLVVSRHAI